MYKHLCFLTVLVLFSCKKEAVNDLPQIDQRLYGRWAETTLTFENTLYKRADRLGEYQRGLVVFNDGTLIERSEGGICVGEYCLMENFYGTYKYDGDKKNLTVKVTNFAGPQNYTLSILNLTTDSLRIKKN